MSRRFITKKNSLILGIVILLCLGFVYPKTSNYGEEMEVLRVGVNEGFEALSTEVNESLNAWEVKIGTNDAELQAVKTTLETNNENIIKLVGSINAVDARVSNSVADYDRVLTRLTTLSRDVVSLSDTVSDLRGEVDVLEEELAVLQRFYAKYAAEARVAYYTTENGFVSDCLWSPIVNPHWAGQQFKVSLSFDVTKINIYARRGAGSPDDVTLKICKVNSLGIPIFNQPLFKITFDADRWSSRPQWHTIEVTHCSLDNGVYVILLGDADGTTSDRIDWGYHYNGKYTGGTWIKSLDNGVTFPITAGIDAGFEVWGNLR